LAARVYDDLKRDIISCVLRPSQVVYEADLAQRYGVSKTPVREALNTLRQEGYIDVVPRRGYIVAPISIQDVQQILNLRMILEPAAAELAAQHATADQLRQLRRLAQRAEAQRDPQAFGVDQQFHVMVAEASGNPRLAKYIAKVLEEVERVYNLCSGLPGPARPGSDRRSLLVDAIMKNDPRLAREIMVETIQEARTRVLELLLGMSSQTVAPIMIASAPEAHHGPGVRDAEKAGGARRGRRARI
jgi:DNA-binding GntR family transcriptional regulator